MHEHMSTPTHYGKLKIQPVDVAEDWGLDFNLGNVLKYIARHKHKGDPVGDLAKAKWYLDRACKEL